MPWNIGPMCAVSCEIDDRVEAFAHGLRYPAATNARAPAGAVKKLHNARHVGVVFAPMGALKNAGDGFFRGFLMSLAAVGGDHQPAPQ